MGSGTGSIPEVSSLSLVEKISAGVVLTTLTGIGANLFVEKYRQGKYLEEAASIDAPLVRRNQILSAYSSRWSSDILLPFYSIFHNPYKQKD